MSSDLPSNPGADRLNAANQPGNVIPLFPASPPPADAVDAAEWRGAGAGLNAIDAMRIAPTQRDRFRVRHEAILTATKGPHRSRGADGLATSSVAFLDRALGLEN